MQGLAVIAALIAIGYGFAAGGVLGALTGFVVAVGVGSGLAIANAERGTGVALAGATRSAQRIGGIVAAIGCLIGAYYGGWRFGWLWAAVGYSAGVLAALLLRAISSQGRRLDTGRAPLRSSLIRTAARLERESAAAVPLASPTTNFDPGVPEHAAVQVLMSIGCALPHAGALVVGERSSHEAVWPTMLLFVATVGLAAALKAEGTRLDADAVFGDVLRGMLQSYPESERVEVLAAARKAAMNIFEEPEDAALAGWAQAVNSAVVSFAETGDPNYRRGIIDLYAAFLRSLKISIRSRVVRNSRKNRRPTVSAERASAALTVKASEPPSGVPVSLENAASASGSGLVRSTSMWG
jgi:hypothetical protein